MQQKDVHEKKAAIKAAITAAADSEYVEEEVDPEEVERLRRRQEGTPVTVETFNNWKKAFDKEMSSTMATTGSAGGMSALTAITVGSSGNNSDNQSSSNAVAVATASIVSGERLTGKQFFLINIGTSAASGAVEGEDDGEDVLSEAEVDAMILAGKAAAGMTISDYDESDNDEDDEDYIDENYSDGEDGK